MPTEIKILAWAAVLLIVHIFAAEEREFYSLERLWGDAPRIEESNSRGVEESKSRRVDGSGATGATGR